MKWVRGGKSYTSPNGFMPIAEWWVLYLNSAKKLWKISKLRLHRYWDAFLFFFCMSVFLLFSPALLLHFYGFTFPHCLCPWHGRWLLWIYCSYWFAVKYWFCIYHSNICLYISLVHARHTNPRALHEKVPHLLLYIFIYFKNSFVLTYMWVLSIKNMIFLGLWS